MSGIKKTENLMIPMRDGIVLACDKYSPDEAGIYPAVLMRLPYLKEGFGNEWLYSDCEELVSRGYHVIIQDVRGTGHSEGVLVSTGASESDDGYDTIEWIAAQDWCDGNVGMYGLSYFGFSQMAAAETAPPHLKAICPFQNSSCHPLSVTKAITVNSYHLQWLYGRVLDSLPIRTDITEEEKAKIREEIDFYRSHWDEYMNQLPLIDTPAGKIENAPLLNDFYELIEGTADPEFWKKAHRPIRFDQIKVPMFFLTGWFDAARDDTVDTWHKALEDCCLRAARDSRLIIGPWQHGGFLKCDFDGFDFGSHNSGKAKHIKEAMYDWFDYWLKGKGDKNYPVVTYYTINADEWHLAESWPPREAKEVSLYIGNSTLSEKCPEETVKQNYVYDPLDPVPSMFADKNGHFMYADPESVYSRPDVLVYRSAPLESDMEITGNVRFNLFASTSAEDTDFYCRLSDTDEEGTSFPVLHGIVRARYRKGIEDMPVIPNEIYSYDIDMGNISYLVKAGHHLTVDISSSAYPEYNRNLNTLDKIGHGSVTVKANQSIFSGSDYPSRLILPVM